MVAESLRLRGGAMGLYSLMARAVAIDAAASARLRQRGPEHVDVFVTTPFEVVAARRVEAAASRDGAVVSAGALYDALRAARSSSPSGAPHIPLPCTLDLGAPRDPSWPGALPPAEGFELVDNLPVEVVRQLADKGQSLARQFSGPLGPPSSLMNQTVLTVRGNGHEAEIPMRLIFACTALKLIPGFAAPLEVPRHLRVSTRGRWVRVDAPFGSVYHSTRLSLF